MYKRQLHARQEGHELQCAEAHERLGDASLQNEQPERAPGSTPAARDLLCTLREGGTLPPHDRRLADVEFYLGVTNLQLGALDEAKAHYRQAAATLRLRRATLLRASLDEQIAGLEQAVAAGGGAAADADTNADAEVREISELVAEIEGRIEELVGHVGGV